MAKKEKKPKKKKGEEEALEDAPAADGEEGGEGEGAPKKKKLSGKNLVLFIILPAVLILGAGGAAAFMLLNNGGGPPEAHAEADTHGKAKGDGHGGGHGAEGGEAVEGAHGVTITQGDGVVFVSLPEMLVNITAADGRPAFLKLTLTIEAPDSATVAALEADIPRVTDQFTAFLRELRTDDLAGSAGAYRLRLELLRRINLVLAPRRVNAVLIEEMLVQ